MIETEPEWDDSNRRAALALQAHDAEKCPLCGRPVAVCQAEANEFAFEGDGPYRCHATTARIQAQRRHADADGEPDPALLWGDRLKPGR